MIKKFFKKITGIAKIEAAREEAEQLKLQAEAAAVKAVTDSVAASKESADAIEAARIAKLSAKDYATFKREPWIEVAETHVNKENVRNGFFELDWNEFFVLQLRQEGFGLEGDADETVVDFWFKELCKNIGAEEGVEMDRRGSGYINVNNLGNGKSEIY